MSAATGGGGVPDAVPLAMGPNMECACGSGFASAGLSLHVDLRAARSELPMAPYCAPTFSILFGSGRIFPTGGGTFGFCCC